jgi:hypothetical protein
MSLIASSSGNVKIWMFDGTRLDILANSVASAEDTLCVRWNHTNQVVGAGTSEGNIHLQHVNTAQILSTLSLQQSGIAGAVRSLAFSNNSRYLASAARNGIHIWDLKKRSIKVSLKGHIADVACVGFAAEGQVLSGDEHGVLKLWDTGRGEAGLDMRRAGSHAGLRHLEVGGQGHAACGYADGCLAVWDAGAGRMLTQFQHLHASPVVCLAMSPKNSKLVIAAGEDGKVHLIDTSAPSGAAPSASLDAGERLTAVSFQENAIHSAVGTADGNILIYDWRSLAKPLCKVPAHSPAPVLSLAFQVPKARASAAAADSSSVGGVSAGSRSHRGDREPEVAVGAGPSRSGRTPERSTPPGGGAALPPPPDASVREEISDLSMASAGRAGSRQPPPPASSAAAARAPTTPTADRRVHMDPKSESRPSSSSGARTSPTRGLGGPRNSLYTSASRLDSPTASVSASVSASQRDRDRDRDRDRERDREREREYSRSSDAASVPPAMDYSAGGGGEEDNFDDLRRRVDPATSQELQEMYQLLR